MDRVRQKRPNTANREPTAVVDLVRLLARQAAREWADGSRGPESALRAPPPEKRR